MSKVYLVEQWRDGAPYPEYQGVFSTEELAVAACKTFRYLVTPFTLDEAYPDEFMGTHPHTYYPITVNG